MDFFKLNIIERFYYRVEVYDTLKEMHKRLKDLYLAFPYKTEKERQKDLKELNTHKAVTLWSEQLYGKYNLGLIVFCKEKFDLYYISHELEHALIFAAKKLNVDVKKLGKSSDDDENLAYAAGRVFHSFFVEAFKRNIVKPDQHELKKRLAK